MTKEEKIKAISELEKEQHKLLKQSLKIAKMKPAKRWQTAIVRAMKVVGLSIRARQVQVQKKIIVDQPTPKFQKGGIMSIKQTGNEVILNKQGSKR